MMNETQYEWATRSFRFPDERAVQMRNCWGAGPWSNEPDKIEWKDKETGMDCIIRRNAQMGFLCGYVAVGPQHPYFEKEYDDIDIDVHGGLTYAAACDGDPDNGVCHPSENGDHAWWFGFDCGHARDLTPGTRETVFNICNMMESSLFSGTDLTRECDQYRDVSYVKQQCEQLAKQLYEKKNA